MSRSRIDQRVSGPAQLRAGTPCWKLPVVAVLALACSAEPDQGVSAGPEVAPESIQVEQPPQGSSDVASAAPSVDPERRPDPDASSSEKASYDLELPTVEVGTVERVMNLPEVDVSMVRKVVRLPFVKLHWKGATDVREQTLQISVLVPHTGYDLQIRELYLVEDELVLISSLEETDPNRPRSEEPSPLRDQMVVSGPPLKLRRYVVTEKLVDVEAQGSARLVGTREELQPLLEPGRKIWEAPQLPTPGAIQEAG